MEIEGQTRPYSVPQKLFFQRTTCTLHASRSRACHLSFHLYEPCAQCDSGWKHTHTHTRTHTHTNRQADRQTDRHTHTHRHTHRHTDRQTDTHIHTHTHTHTHTHGKKGRCTGRNPGIGRREGCELSTRRKFTRKLGIVATGVLRIPPLPSRIPHCPLLVCRIHHGACDLVCTHSRGAENNGRTLNSAGCCLYVLSPRVSHVCELRSLAVQEEQICCTQVAVPSLQRGDSGCSTVLAV